MNRRVVNLFAGPGTGKSTTMAALFAELKYRGYNTEMNPEYAKRLAWEGRGLTFQAQEYIFAKNNWELRRMFQKNNELDFVITDSPLLLTLIYTTPEFEIPSIRNAALEAASLYENLNIFLKRADFGTKAYNPKGRLQGLEEAQAKDREILDMLKQTGTPYEVIEFSRTAPSAIITLMCRLGWL